MGPTPMGVGRHRQAKFDSGAKRGEAPGAPGGARRGRRRGACAEEGGTTMRAGAAVQAAQSRRISGGDGGGYAGPAGGAGVGRHPPWGRGRPGGAGGCGRGPRGGVRRGGPDGQPGHPAAKPARVGIRTFTGQAVVDMMEKTILPGYRQKAPQHTVEWEQQTTGSGAQMIEAVTTTSAACTPPGRLLHRVGLDRAASPGAPDQGTSPPSSRPGARTRSTTPARSSPCGARVVPARIASCDAYLYRLDCPRGGPPGGPGPLPRHLGGVRRRRPSP